MRIALIGDRGDTVLAHRVIPIALDLASQALRCCVDESWISTLDPILSRPETLRQYHGVWVVPGSPYENMDAVLAAIRFAREACIPFLGTCGGFQHALIEIARQRLGLLDADHEESNPGTTEPLVSRLSCSLVECRGGIRFTPGSLLARLYERMDAIEGYHCNYGLNPGYEAALISAGVVFSGRDEAGEVRTFELPDHPFFVGTLFQPERSALEGITHPIVCGFLKAAELASRAGI